MTREWQPGDVANVLHRGFQPAFRHQKGWTYIDGSTATTAADGYTFRPLVVIDPEDDTQIFRLLDALTRQDWDVDDDSSLADMQAALREYADPPSPRPDEPLLLGAVVQDNNTIWLRDGLDKDGASDGPWWSPDRSKEGSPEPWRLYWSDLENPRVLSPGYDPEATS